MPANSTQPTGGPIVPATLTEAEWVARFKPVSNPIDESCGFDFGGGCTLVETYGGHTEYLDTIDPSHVWTVLENEETDDYDIVNGRHLVNRVGYIVTEIPWDQEYQVSLA